VGAGEVAFSEGEWGWLTTSCYLQQPKRKLLVGGGLIGLNTRKSDR